MECQQRILLKKGARNLLITECRATQIECNSRETDSVHKTMGDEICSPQNPVTQKGTALEYQKFNVSFPRPSVLVGESQTPLPQLHYFLKVEARQPSRQQEGAF